MLWPSAVSIGTKPPRGSGGGAEARCGGICMVETRGHESLIPDILKRGFCEDSVRLFRALFTLGVEGALKGSSSIQVLDVGRVC